MGEVTYVGVGLAQDGGRCVGKNADGGESAQLEAQAARSDGSE